MILRIGHFGANSSQDHRGLRAHLCRVERGESAVDNQGAAITETMDNYQLCTFCSCLTLGTLGTGGIRVSNTLSAGGCLSIKGAL